MRNFVFRPLTHESHCFNSVQPCLLLLRETLSYAEIKLLQHLGIRAVLSKVLDYCLSRGLTFEVNYGDDRIGKIQISL